MCRQSFRYFACGHNRIVNEKCELATDHPFFLLLACPSYSSTSFQTSNACGIGCFYCSQGPDGDTLDYAHLLYTSFHGQTNRAAREANALVERLHLAQAQVDHALFPRYLRVKPPVLRTLEQLHAEAIRRYEVLKTTAGKTRAYISAARSHYARLQQSERMGNGASFPPLPCPTWMAKASHNVEDPCTPPSQTRDASLTAVGGMLVPLADTPSKRQSAQRLHNHTPLASAHNLVTARASTPSRPPLLKQQSPTSPLAASAGKPLEARHTRRPPRKQTTPTPLRRSTRRKKKPINYAEDEDDDKSPSRESSPISTVRLQTSGHRPEDYISLSDILRLSNDDKELLIRILQDWHTRTHESVEPEQPRNLLFTARKPALSHLPNTVDYEMPHSITFAGGGYPNHSMDPFFTPPKQSTFRPTQGISGRPSTQMAHDEVLFPQPLPGQYSTPVMSPSPGSILNGQPATEPRKRPSVVNLDQPKKRLRLSLPGVPAGRCTPAPQWVPTTGNHDYQKTRPQDTVEEDEYMPDSPESHESILEADDEWLP